MIFIMGELARLALCKLAIPLAIPGPKWRRVAAGLPVMRPIPSAAPAQTPSNRASTDLTLGTASSACTRCISEVPGFAIQNSTPQSARVFISAVAPFMLLFNARDRIQLTIT